MLKRFKRAGVWALALSMAVTMTPATAFADVETGESEPLAVQVDGGTQVAEAPAAEAPAPGEVNDPNANDPNGNNPTEEKTPLDERFGMSMWNFRSLLPFVGPVAYGEVRSFNGDWKTGDDNGPQLQPVEGQTLEDLNLTRNYAFFKNMNAAVWAISTDVFGPFGTDNADGSEAEDFFKATSAAGMNEPGFVVERITSDDPDERAVYGIHMTAVDVTVTADDANMIDDNYGEHPVFTVTETLGEYPKALDEQMKANKGTMARSTYVEMGNMSPSNTAKLIPMFKYPVEVYDELKSVCGYSVVGHIQPKNENDGNEIVDLVHGMWAPFELKDDDNNNDEPQVLSSQAEDDVITANSDEVEEAVKANDIDAFAEAVGIDTQEESGFDFDALNGYYDPPLHVELAQGTFKVYADARPLSADKGTVEKQLKATQLDSSYNTKVTMTLPVTNVDPEDYFKTSGYAISSGPGIPIPIDFREAIAVRAGEESVDAQYDSSSRFDITTYPKQKETILSGSMVVMNLADDFTLPTGADGKLDLSKLRLVDYKYFYEPEKKPAEVVTTGEKIAKMRWYDTYKEYVAAHSKWFKDNYFSEGADLTTQRGYYVSDLKGYKIELPSYYEEEFEKEIPVEFIDPKADVSEEYKEGPGSTEPKKTEIKMEMYGFGLKTEPKPDSASGGDDPQFVEPPVPPEVNLNQQALVPAPFDGESYMPWMFEYLVYYFPEGIGALPDNFHMSLGYDADALEEPCLIVEYLGSGYSYGPRPGYAELKSESVSREAISSRFGNPYGSSVLNPLHYFEFSFEEKLNNVSSASGTHGTYDADGKLQKDSIKVLDSATLFRPNVADYFGYLDSGGGYLKSAAEEVEVNGYYSGTRPQEKPEEFYVPTVSYTVPGGGGSSGGGRSSGGLTITEPQVPLAELPELNKKDHVAYVIGYEDGTVRPENLITRAEVSTIFFRLLTDDSRRAIWSSNNSYKDTAATAWYNNAVSTLSNGGVLSGYTDGTFLPSGNITRAEFATIAARFDESVVDTSSVSFSDISGHWAENNIKRAAALGYITGYQDGSFKPNAPITRAEAMTLMNRVLGRDKISAAGLLDNMAKWSDNPTSAWYYVAVQEATNSHDYTITDGVETWTSILPNRDWAALEKEWATGAERGAEVFQPVEEETPAAETEEPAAEETPAAEFEAGAEAEA